MESADNVFGIEWQNLYIIELEKLLQNQPEQFGRAEFYFLSIMKSCSKFRWKFICHTVAKVYHFRLNNYSKIDRNSSEDRRFIFYYKKLQTLIFSLKVLSSSHVTEVGNYSVTLSRKVTAKWGTKSFQLLNLKLWINHTISLLFVKLTRVVPTTTRMVR